MQGHKLQYFFEIPPQPPHNCPRLGREKHGASTSPDAGGEAVWTSGMVSLFSLGQHLELNWQKPCPIVGLVGFPAGQADFVGQRVKFFMAHMTVGWTLS